MEKKLINLQQQLRLCLLTTVLLFSTVTLITADNSQNIVFAQNNTSTLNSEPITPAPESSDNDESDSTSSSDDSDNNDGNDESNPSGSVDNADDVDDSKQDTATGDSGDVEDTAANEEETEVDLVQMNPLLEQIRESVSKALSATGTDDQ